MVRAENQLELFCRFDSDHNMREILADVRRICIALVCNASCGENEPVAF